MTRREVINKIREIISSYGDDAPEALYETFLHELEYMLAEFTRLFVREFDSTIPFVLQEKLEELANNKYDAEDLENAED